MMNSPFRLLIVALLLVTAVLGTASVYADSIAVRVGSVEAAPGEVAEVPITIEGSTGLSAMHLELTHDPALLAVESVEQGSMVAGSALLAFNTDEPGRIIISLAASDEITGDGTLALVRFQVSGEKGQTTALGLEYAQAWDGEGFEIAVDAEPGQFTVGSSGLSPLVLVALVILALVLILLVVLILVLRGRRKPPSPAPVQPGPRPPAAPPTRQPPPGQQPPPSQRPPAPARKFCGFCGQSLEPGKPFCVHCGQPAGS